ncbi:MAG: DUF2249 domain-containing protein [Micrococcales bacterium]|nr:DUF2249 domain-containing protein [Micrococcales bacterium]
MTVHPNLPLTQTAPGHAGGCGCGGHDEALPELDARLIPHAIRHGAIIGAFGQLTPGAAMVLVAPHNPLPLLNQMRNLFGEQIEISYLLEGPEAWKLTFAKKA